MLGHFPVVQRGWAVVISARRGQAGSDGQYDDGFSVVRAVGCFYIPPLSLAAADRALRGSDAASSRHWRPLLPAFPTVWANDVEAGLDQIGLPSHVLAG